MADSSLDSFITLPTDSETTSQEDYLQEIAYNTRMTSLGVSHIFCTCLVLLIFAFLWVILKRWFFPYV